MGLSDKTGNKKSIFITFLISYIAILFISIAVGSVSYVWSAHVLKENIEKYTMAMLEQSQKVIDSQMYMADRMILEIALNSKIQEFMYIEQPITHNDKYIMSEIIQYISSLKTINSFVDEIYIYFHNMDAILNGNGKYELSLFYNELVPSSGILFEEWHEQLKQYSSMKVLPAMSLNRPYNKEAVTLLQSIPLGSKNSIAAAIGVTINTNDMAVMLRSINVINRGNVFIFDKDNQLIMTVGNLENLNNFRFDPQKLTSQKGYYYENIAGKESIVSFISSNYNGWEYIAVIPTEEFMDDLKLIRYITFGAVIICLLIGGSIAYYLARKNYKPIKEVVELFKDKYKEIPQKGKNEIMFIREATTAAVLENQQFQDILQKQYPIVRSTLLMQLLKGNVNSLNALSCFSGEYEVRFSGKLFCTLIVKIYDCIETEMNNLVEERTVVNVVIMNFMEEFAHMGYTAYVVDIDWNEVAIIVNFHDNRDNFKKEILELSRVLKDLLQRSFSVYASIAIGSIYEGIFGIQKSYKDAAKAIEYKMIKGKSSIHVFDDIQYSKQAYSYSLDTEYQLINSIKVGDLDKARELLASIFRDNFSDRRLSIELTRCLFFDIMSTIIKLVDEIDATYTDIFDNAYDPISRLTACNTFDDMDYEIESILKRVCDYVHTSKKSHNDKLKEDIITYINMHFADNNISLNSIADKIEITPNYLSSFFKEQVGVKIFDYINNLRLDMAKKLLKESADSITLIAEKVGYTNSAIFIRSFKKYEGITPGQYRDADFQTGN